MQSEPNINTNQIKKNYDLLPVTPLKYRLLLSSGLLFVCTSNANSCIPQHRIYILFSQITL